MTRPSTHVAAAARPAPSYLGSLTALTSLFFMWGLITSLNDILVPHLKSAFTLSYVQATLIQFAFFGAYFVMSLPAGWLVEKVGYKLGIIIGLAVAGIGCLLFYPAAAAEAYPLFLGALFVLASGITLLQVAANPYVTTLGPPRTASSRLTLTQAFNSLGTTIGPTLGARLILTSATVGTAAEAALVQKPYLGLAAVLFLIAAAFVALKLPAIEGSGGAGGTEPRASLWSHRHLVLGVAAIFVYVGGEVAIGSFLVSFMSDPAIAGLSVSEAGGYVSYYWGAAMVGRFVGAAVMWFVRPGRVLAFNAVAAVVLLGTAMLTAGDTAMWCVLAVGFFNSIMFPTIFALALNGLGKHTGEGSGVLCMAIVGGALVPVLQGYFADHMGLLHSFVVPLVCYVYIFYYGLSGHRPVWKPAV